jgi:MFS family permease
VFQPHSFRRSKYFRRSPSQLPEPRFSQTMYARWLIADGLGVPGDNGQMSWVAAGFSITTGSFVLVGGRLGDVYGHRLVWLLALVWSMIWNLGEFLFSTLVCC